MSKSNIHADNNNIISLTVAEEFDCLTYMYMDRHINKHIFITVST